MSYYNQQAIVGVLPPQGYPPEGHAKDPFPPLSYPPTGYPPLGYPPPYVQPPPPPPQQQKSSRPSFVEGCLPDLLSPAGITRPGNHPAGAR